MKFFKVFLLLLLCISFNACQNKRKAGDGVRVPIFQINETIELGKKVEITTSNRKTADNYYGSSISPKVKIDNFRVDINFSNKLFFKKHLIASNFGKEIHNPVIVDDVIYTVNRNGFLEAREFDESAKLLWKVKVFGKKTIKKFKGARIVYNNGYLAVSSNLNEIAVVNLKGELLWRKELNSILISNPVMDDENIYITSNDNKLYALETVSGKINFIHFGISKNTSITGTGDPILYKNLVFASYSSGEIYAVDKQSGETVWSDNLAKDKFIFSDFELTDINATPQIYKDVLFVVNNNSSFKALNPNNGNLIWRKELESINDYWINNDIIYIINNDNILLALSTQDGGIQWIKTLEINSNSKTRYNYVTMINDLLFLSNTNKEIILVSPMDGKILKVVKSGIISKNEPIIVNNRLFLSYSTLFSNKLLEIR